VQCVSINIFCAIPQRKRRCGFSQLPPRHRGMAMQPSAVTAKAIIIAGIVAARMIAVTVIITGVIGGVFAVTATAMVIVERNPR